MSSPKHSYSLCSSSSRRPSGQSKSPSSPSSGKSIYEDARPFFDYEFRSVIIQTENWPLVFLIPFLLILLTNAILKGDRFAAYSLGPPTLLLISTLRAPRHHPTSLLSTLPLLPRIPRGGKHQRISHTYMYPLYAGLYFALASTWFSSARPQLSILYLSFADLLLMRVLHLSGDFPKWLFWRPDSPLVLLDSLLHWWILSATREVRWVRGWRMQYWIAAQLVFRLGRLLSRVFRGIEVGAPEVCVRLRRSVPEDDFHRFWRESLDETVSNLSSSSIAVNILEGLILQIELATLWVGLRLFLRAFWAPQLPDASTLGDMSRIWLSAWSLLWDLKGWLSDPDGWFMHAIIWWVGWLVYGSMDLATWLLRSLGKVVDVVTGGLAKGDGVFVEIS